MLTEIWNFAIYGTTIFSLFVIDYLLGNGLVDILQKIFCKMVCFVKKTIKVEEKQVELNDDNAISLPVLLAEIMCLGLTIVFLNKYKEIRCKDRIDDLLQDSKEALRQTNEFLEKWRLRRRTCQVPTECSYLDDEPQAIRPYKLEVPILHMAIIDVREVFSVPFVLMDEKERTLGTARNQPERGDAGDTINITDSTLLSMTSLIDDDFESITEPAGEERIVNSKCIEYGNRFLWDVVEEDFVMEE